MKKTRSEKKLKTKKWFSHQAHRTVMILHTYIGAFVLVLEMLSDERGALYGVHDVIRVRCYGRRRVARQRLPLAYRHTSSHRQRHLSPRSAAAAACRHLVSRLVGAAAVTFGSGLWPQRRRRLFERRRSTVEVGEVGGSALGGQRGTQDALLGGVRSSAGIR